MWDSRNGTAGELSRPPAEQPRGFALAAEAESQKIPKNSPAVSGIIPAGSPALSGINPRQSPGGSGIRCHPKVVDTRSTALWRQIILAVTDN
jgi:hypothetical protein